MHLQKCGLRDNLNLSINNDSLEVGLAGIKIDFDCDDINVVVAQYDTSLSRLLDKLAPLKKICSVDRPMGDWMTDDIRAVVWQ